MVNSLIINYNVIKESGSMQIIKDNENIRMLSAGEGFGEAALLCNEPRFEFFYFLKSIFLLYY